MIDNDQNTYASIVNIFGRTQDMIMMLTNVVPMSFVNTKNLELGVENTFTMSMTPKTLQSSEIKISIKPETCFFLLGEDNVYSPDTEVTINTDRSVGNGLIEGMIICYQGLSSLDLIKQNIAEAHHVVIEDTIGMIVPLNKIDQLKDAYSKHKSLSKKTDVNLSS